MRATSNRLKRRTNGVFEPELIQASAGIGLQHQCIQDHFPDANVPGDSRAGNVLPPCGQRRRGRKAMSVILAEICRRLGPTIRVVVHALLIALVIRTFLFQPFNISIGVDEGDTAGGDGYLFVSALFLRLQPYSISLSPPLFSGRIFGSQPDRATTWCSACRRMIPPATSSA